MKEELFEDYYRDTCLIGKQDMIAFMKENTSYSLKENIEEAKTDVHVVIGAKENMEIRRSAELICSRLPSSKFTCLEGLYHGEFSINHPEKYTETVRRICGGGR